MGSPIGHERPHRQWATAAAVGTGAARTAMGRRRRRRRRHRRGAWGRPQRVPVKSLNCKEKIEMREIPQNQDLTGNLTCKVVFYPKN